MSASPSAVGRESVADWIESTVLARGSRQMGWDEVDRIAEEELHVSPALVGLAGRVMRLRSSHLGKAYPFVVDDLAIRCRSESTTQPYAALLHLAPGSPCRQLLFRDPTDVMERIFEEIASLAAAQLWGSAGRALRFGWPSDIGRPQAFGDAVAWLAQQMNLTPGAGYRPPKRKDGGVDVVAWRPFPDGRPGFPILLVQCTLQAELESKSADIDTRVWASWLKMDVDPTTALATPSTIGAGPLWDQLTLRGLVLDRIRLAGLTQDVELPDPHRSWVLDVTRELQNALAGAAQ